MSNCFNLFYFNFLNMRKSYGRMIAGVLFAILGGSRVAMDNGGLLIFGVCMLLYGIFSIGYGIFLYRKGE